MSEALASFRSAGNRRGEAWALQNLAWISFSNGEIPKAEKRLNASADVFSELGDWGGLGWAYGLLAFVRFNQGRLDEAATLAEHISIEGVESGNRWAVGMMSVLLAGVNLWRGQVHKSVAHGREAIALFQDIGDRWGEVMATGSVVRGLAELGRDPEYADNLAHYRTIARGMPDEGMRTFPEVLEACVDLQQGRPDDAQAILENLLVDEDEEGQLGVADVQSALGLALLQLGKLDDAIDRLTRAYGRVTDDGPAMALGCRLALAYAAAHRDADAEVSSRSSSRAPAARTRTACSCSGPTAWCAPAGAHPTRASRSTRPTTSRWAPTRRSSTRSRRSPARRCSTRWAPTTRPRRPTKPSRLLGVVGLTAEGWARVFDLALAEVSVPS